MAGLVLVSHVVCPFVQRAAIALLEKGVSFERRNIDLSNRPEWFVRISPLGKVPLLIVPGQGGTEVVLFESNVICEYFEDTQPGVGLHPRDPLQRATHRAWMEFASSVIADLWQMQTTKEAEVFHVTAHRLAARLATVEKAMDDDGPWFSGPAFSLVDAAFAPIFRYFELLDPVLDPDFWEPIPKAGRWRAALAQRPSVVRAVRRDYTAYLQEFLRSYDPYLLRIER